MHLPVLLQTICLMWEAEFPVAASQWGRENPESQEGPGRIKQVNPLAVTTSLCGDYTKLLLGDARWLGRSQG